jgi:hypothetical protein
MQYRMLYHAAGERSPVNEFRFRRVFGGCCASHRPAPIHAIAPVRMNASLLLADCVAKGVVHHGAPDKPMLLKGISLLQLASFEQN